MNVPAFLRFCALIALSAPAVHAQVAATLQIAKRQFMAGEAVVATVTITNHSGNTLTFQGSNRQPWLDFVVKRGTQPSTPIAVSNFGSLTLPSGESARRSVNLSSLFNLAEMGSYSVFAAIRTPGQGNEAYSTNRFPFNVVTGHPYWTQKVGVPGKPSEVREYRIINHPGAQKTELFLQVMNDRTGSPLRTYSLGEILSFRKPQMKVDRKQHLHVFFLTSPSLFSYAEIDPNGQPVVTQLYHRGSVEPGLVSFPDGTVMVANGVPYDPVAQAAERAKVRKASDRPTIGR